jgi:hypothetical protein
MRNWKWWVGLFGLVLEGTAGALRLKYGGSSVSLILLLLGIGLMFIWLTETFSKARFENYELLPKKNNREKREWEAETRGTV